MKTSRLVLRLLLPISLCACSLSHGAHHSDPNVAPQVGEDASIPEDSGTIPVAVESDAGTPASEPNPGSDVLWRFAREGDQLALVGVDFAAGTLESRQFTLPFGFNDVTYAEAWGTDIVRFELNDGGQVLMAQGDTWTELARAVAGEWLNVEVSDDSSLAWVSVGSHDPNGSPSLSVLSITLALREDGSEQRSKRQLFHWLAAAPGDKPPTHLAFAPFGELFLLDRQVFLVSPSVLPPAPLFTVQDSSAAVIATFAHSFILADKYPSAHWLGEHGELLSVPGFAGDLSRLRGGYQLDGTKLSMFDDGKVTYVQDLGMIGETDELWAVRRQAGPLALIRRDRDYQFIGDHGAELASYKPLSKANTDACTFFATLSDEISNVTFSSLERDKIYLAAFVNHECYSGDSIESLGESVDIVALDRKTGAHSLTRVLDTTAEQSMPSYELTESGDFLGGVIDGDISRVPTHDGPPTTLSFDGLVFLDWVVHPRSTGP
jgi:hypothetical protein